MGSPGSSSGPSKVPRVTVTSPPSSRASSHAPAVPSKLRSSELVPRSPEDDDSGSDGSCSPRSQPVRHPHIHDDEIQPIEHSPTEEVKRPNVAGNIDEGEVPTARTYLLQHVVKKSDVSANTGSDHGRRPSMQRNYDSFTSQIGFQQAVEEAEEAYEEEGIKSGLQAFVGALFNRAYRKSTTTHLAERYDVNYSVWTYLSYYIPFLQWIRLYNLSYLPGDLVAAITMASFYIPMALSLASNLGHIPAINGLYAFVFQPFFYALLGTCPQLVVGPEAAGSLLVGTVVRSSVDHGSTSESDELVNARIAGVVTAIAGTIILMAGIARLGFLDSVLSRPLLRGFISAIGVVIFVDQLVPELGLTERAKEVGGISHGSTVEKIMFIGENTSHIHLLTSLVSLVAFVCIMVVRQLKAKLQPRFPKLAYIPDRFIIVALSAILTWQLRWDRKGLAVLGEVKPATGAVLQPQMPFSFAHMKHVREAMSTAFLIAILGFFESSVAAKSLGAGDGTFSLATGVSANRELVALGVANVVGSCFMSLPAFGGYGRSKINRATGGTSPMSSVLLSLITLTCVLFLLPAFYYLPRAVLSTMISVVAYSLLEEAPEDIHFFYKIGGWFELLVMSIIFLSTIFYSLSLGIAIGVGISVISVIKHATRPRIQILGRVPDTNKFESAEGRRGSLEFFDGCLIIKIPEPLTFANTGELKNRLRRLELYGTTGAHPSLPRVRDSQHNRNVIFDVHGVTSMDGSGAQVLTEIVESYRVRGVRVFFCRVPHVRSQVFNLFIRSGIVESCGGRHYFVESVEEALALSEREDVGEEFRTGV